VVIVEQKYLEGTMVPKSTTKFGGYDICRKAKDA